MIAWVAPITLPSYGLVQYAAVRLTELWSHGVYRHSAWSGDASHRLFNIPARLTSAYAFPTPDSAVYLHLATTNGCLELTADGVLLDAVSYLTDLPLFRGS